MTKRKAKPKAKVPNLLDQKQATVSLHRNGLTIEVANVPASDGAVVAAAMLDAFRELTRKYDELVVDAGGVHAGVVDQAEEYDEPDGSMTPEAKRRKRIGFLG